MSTQQCVAGVVFDSSGAVLLAKRAAYKKIAPGAWHLPGGAVEEGESREDAVARELKEEFGLVVTHAWDTGMSLIYDDGTVYVLAVTVVNEPRIANEENEAFEFVLVDRFNQYLEPHLVDQNLKAVVTASGLVNLP